MFSIIPNSVKTPLDVFDIFPILFLLSFVVPVFANMKQMINVTFNQLDCNNNCYDEVRSNSCYYDAGFNSCYNKSGCNICYDEACLKSCYDKACISILLRKNLTEGSDEVPPIAQVLHVFFNLLQGAISDNL